MYSCRPPHIDEQRQDDQVEPTYRSFVPIRDVALKTCRKQRTVEKAGERGSGISVLMVWHDDDVGALHISGRNFRKKLYFYIDVKHQGSIPGCVIPKTLKMVLDTSLLNTQQYKVRIEGKVEQSREESSALPYTSV